MCVDTATGVPAAIWRQAPVPGGTDGDADSPSRERAPVIALEPVDEISVTTVVDNFFDGTLTDTAVAKRADLGRAVRSPAPWTVEGSIGDLPVAEHGFSALVTLTRSGRRHQVLFDAGISPTGAVENMRRLDISPMDIEAVVLSHGHFDHTTGLDGRSSPSAPVNPRPAMDLRRRWAGWFFFDQSPGRLWSVADQVPALL